MSSSGYTTWSVTAGEVPTTAKWNILGANDASFNTGNGLNDGVIVARHLASKAVTVPSLGAPSAVCVYLKQTSANLNFSSWTSIAWDNTWYNTGPTAYVVTGNQVSVPYSGLYTVTLNVSYNNAQDGQNYLASLSVNSLTGPQTPWNREYTGFSGEPTVELTLTLPLNANDNVTAWCYPGGSSGTNAVLMGQTTTIAGKLQPTADVTYMTIKYEGPLS